MFFTSAWRKFVSKNFFYRPKPHERRRVNASQRSLETVRFTDFHVRNFVNNFDSTFTIKIKVPTSSQMSLWDMMRAFASPTRRRSRSRELKRRKTLQAFFGVASIAFDITHVLNRMPTASLTLKKMAMGRPPNPLKSSSTGLLEALDVVASALSAAGVNLIVQVTYGGAGKAI